MEFHNPIYYPLQFITTSLSIAEWPNLFYHTYKQTVMSMFYWVAYLADKVSSKKLRYIQKKMIVKSDIELTCFPFQTKQFIWHVTLVKLRKSNRINLHWVFQSITNQSNWLLQISQKRNCASIQLFVPLNHSMDSTSPYRLRANPNDDVEWTNVFPSSHVIYILHCISLTK